jgi:hypothetical protein
MVFTNDTFYGIIITEKMEFCNLRRTAVRCFLSAEITDMCTVPTGAADKAAPYDNYLIITVQVTVMITFPIESGG